VCGFFRANMVLRRLKINKLSFGVHAAFILMMFNGEI